MLNNKKGQNVFAVTGSKINKKRNILVSGFLKSCSSDWGLIAIGGNLLSGQRLGIVGVETEEMRGSPAPRLPDPGGHLVSNAFLPHLEISKLQVLSPLDESA
jgi:hypothetical protein